MSSLLKFHHIGYATTSIEKDLKYFLSLGYFLESDLFIDDNQKIKGCFLIGNGPRLELLENLNDGSVLDPFLKFNIKMYHIGYLTKDIEKSILDQKSLGSKIIKYPTPAIAFNNAKVSFLMMKNNQLIELIEDKNE